MLGGDLENRLYLSLAGNTYRPKAKYLVMGWTYYIEHILSVMGENEKALLTAQWVGRVIFLGLGRGYLANVLKLKIHALR